MSLFVVVVLFNPSCLLFLCLSLSSLRQMRVLSFFYFFTVPRIMALLCWTKFRIICNTRGWKVLLLLHWTDWVSPVWNRIDGAGWQRVDVCAFFRVLYLIILLYLKKLKMSMLTLQSESALALPAKPNTNIQT